MALPKVEIIKMAKNFLEQLCKKHDVAQAYLFGSSTKGITRYHSDVDIAIVLRTLAHSDESPFDEEFEIFHEAQNYSSLLEVVCFVQNEFDRNSDSIIKHIKKQGIRLI